MDQESSAAYRLLELRHRVCGAAVELVHVLLEVLVDALAKVIHVLDDGLHPLLLDHVGPRDSVLEHTQVPVEGVGAGLALLHPVVLETVDAS